MANKSSGKIPLFESAVADQCVIDMEHLSRQTMGDEQLAAEILSMFVRQCENCIKAINECFNSQDIFQIAHQMKGCAQSVGAFEIAAAAELLEEDPSNSKNLNSLRGLCTSVQDSLILRQ